MHTHYKHFEIYLNVTVLLISWLYKFPNNILNSKIIRKDISNLKLLNFNSTRKTYCTLFKNPIYIKNMRNVSQEGTLL